MTFCDIIINRAVQYTVQFRLWYLIDKFLSFYQDSDTTNDALVHVVDFGDLAYTLVHNHAPSYLLSRILSLRSGTLDMLRMKDALILAINRDQINKAVVILEFLIELGRLDDDDSNAMIDDIMNTVLGMMTRVHVPKHFIELLFTFKRLNFDMIVSQMPRWPRLEHERMLCRFMTRYIASLRENQ